MADSEPSSSSASSARDTGAKKRAAFQATLARLLEQYDALAQQRDAALVSAQLSQAQIKALQKAQTRVRSIPRPAE